MNVFLCKYIGFLKLKACISETRLYLSSCDYILPVTSRVFYGMEMILEMNNCTIVCMLASNKVEMLRLW